MDFEIEENIVMPSQKLDYPFAEMKVGDSFCFSEDIFMRVRQSGYDYGSRHGMKLTVRKTGEGKARCWRVE